MAEYIEYLRKSQFDRDFATVSIEETLQRHEKQLHELVIKRHLNVTKVLKEVVSGESLWARPKMLECLELINTGKYDGVVCMDIDRLSRGSSYDSGYIMQVLQINNCKIITPLKDYDLSNEIDELSTDMQFMFSRTELKTITKRLVRGRLQSVKEGKYVGSIAPYGYDRIKLEGTKGNALRVNPAEAEIVKQMFDWYTIDHIGVTLIAVRLKALGIKTRAGNDWFYGTISKMLQNEVYTGKIRWSYKIQKKIIVDGKIQKKRRTNPEYELSEGLHEAIISDEQFAEAQRIRADRALTSNTVGRSLKNPFAGLLYCANCNRTLRRNEDKGRKTPISWYRCDTPFCNTHTVRCDELEELIIEKVADWLKEYEVKIEEAPKQKSHDAEILNNVKLELEKLQGQQRKICELLETGVYSLELFSKRNEALQADIDNLKSSAAALEASIKAAGEAKEAEEKIIPITQHLLDNYDSLTIEEKNNLWKQIIKKITYLRRETGGEIELVIYPKLPNSMPM